MYKKDNLKDLLGKYDYRNLDLSEKNVLLRTCLNVVTDDNGNITDDTRLIEALPVIKDIAKKAKRLIIFAHLGRPSVEKISTKKYSFKKVAERLNAELKGINIGTKSIEVLLLDGPEFVKHYVKDIDTYKVVLLENTRLNPLEEGENEIERAKLANSYAEIADIYVNDAFPDYRESVSTYDIAKLIPSYLGTTFIKEVEELSNFSDPEKPFVAVLGGAKLSEKLDAMNSLLEKADLVIVGGAMAYTLLRAKGVQIGASLFEEDKIEVAKEMIEKYGNKIVLPIDHMITDKFSEPMESVYTSDQVIPDAKVAIDIGPKTIHLYQDIIRNARSILVNGPMGVFEWDKSNKGTYHIYDCVVNNKEAFKLAGGGETISAINKFHITGFDHISTGGGAMLAFLAYEKFPTLDVILDKNI